MSNNPNDDDPNERVQDDGTVDQKLKNRIIKARQRIDDREDLLYVQTAADPEVNLTNVEATSAWTTTVRQYIRSIRPLLVSDEIEESEHYWEEVALGEREYYPPKKAGVDWGHLAQENSLGLLRQYGLSRHVDVPESHTVKFEGLRSVLEREGISLSWRIDTKPKTNRGDKNADDVVHINMNRPVPKRVLENAVSVADEFLQEIGIGLELGTGDFHGKT